MRDFSAKRCFICGEFMVFNDGELICPQCNCTISEVDYHVPCGDDIIDH